MPPSIGTYVPTLGIRPSEMNGLEYLPGLSKDLIMPVILLAPWSISRSLSKAMDRVDRAFPRGRFFFDLDHDYLPTNEENPAQAEWLGLNDPSNCFQAWCDFWTQFERVMPCLQLQEQSKDDIKSQVTFVQESEREFCLRFEVNRLPRNHQDVIDALVEVGTADYTVIIEGGWVQDPLTFLSQAEGLIAGAFADLDGRIPIVVSYTSIPKSFQEIEGLSETTFLNRELLRQLRRNTNRETLLYGDWGSTKPREYGFARAPAPRIDYPAMDAWHIARNTVEDWGYREAAQAIIESTAWDGQLGIWGEEMIMGTALNPDFYIDTPQKNVAARVNIHLHRQALYDRQISGIDLDEDWFD